jgi:hypothetical protein
MRDGSAVDPVLSPAIVAMVAPGSDSPAGARGPDIGRWARDLADLADAGDDAARIDQIRQLEDIKSACAAAQARITASFAASQRAANVPHPGDPAGATSAASAGDAASANGTTCAGAHGGPDGDLDTDELRRTAGGSSAQRRAERRAKAERLARRSAAAQVALARRESPQRGGRFVGLADVLTREMPNTLAALASGVINEWRAMTIVRETACLTAQQRSQVDAEIDGRLDGLGDARIRALVMAITYRLDPEAATKRSVRAASDRRLAIRPAPDAMAYLTALMPIATAVACFASLCRYVDTRPAVDGDTRTRDQRIIDEYVARLMGTSAGIVGARPDYDDDIAVVGAPDGVRNEDDVAETDESNGGDGVAGTGESEGGDGVAGTGESNGGDGVADEANGGDGVAGTDEANGGAELVDEANGDDRVAGTGETNGGDGVANRRSADGVATDPASTDPASTDPASTDPASTDPASTDPASTDPVAAVRAAYARAVAESVISAGQPPPTGADDVKDPAGQPKPQTEHPAGRLDRSARECASPHRPVANATVNPGDRSAWGMPAGTDVMVNIVITDRALLAGGDDPAILPGNYPIPAPLARRLIADLPPEARVWTRRLYTRPGSGELVAQDSRSREFPRAMRRLLLTRDQTCRTPWCSARSRHADHLRPAAAGGATSLANGQGLSEDCNYIRTAPGWSARRDPDGSGDIVVTTPTGHRYRSPCPDLVPGHTRHPSPRIDVRHHAEQILEWQLTHAG